MAWGPNVAAGEPVQAETRREVLFDHYHQHTGGLSFQHTWLLPAAGRTWQLACICLEIAVTIPALAPAEHCPHCQKALRGVRAARAGLLGAAGAAFLGLAYAWGRGAAAAAPVSLGLLAGLGASLALRSALAGLEQAFIYTDWRHADH